MKKSFNDPQKTINIILITFVIGIISLIVERILIPYTNLGLIYLFITGYEPFIGELIIIIGSGMLIPIVYFGMIKFKVKINSKKMNIILLANFICTFFFGSFTLASLWALITIYLALILYMSPKKSTYKPNILCMLFVVIYCWFFIQTFMQTGIFRYELSEVARFVFAFILYILRTIYLLPMANYFRLYGNRRKEISKTIETPTSQQLDGTEKDRKETSKAIEISTEKIQLDDTTKKKIH